MPSVQANTLRGRNAKPLRGHASRRQFAGLRAPNRSDLVSRLDRPLIVASAYKVLYRTFST